MVPLKGSATCKFCKRTFRNKQAVKAHLKGCIAYRDRVPRQSVGKAMPEATNASRARDSGHYPKVEKTTHPICEPIFKPQAAAQRLTEADAEVTLWEREEEEERAREHQRTRMERRREMFIASAIRYAERRFNVAPGLEIWDQRPAMEKLKVAVASEVVGTESPEDIKVLVDELLLPFLEEGRYRAEEERKVKLVEFGKEYAKEELDEEKDLNPFERTMICERVRQALEKRLVGDETTAQVEDLVEDLLDDERL